MNFESLQEVAQAFVKNGLFDKAEDIYSFVTTLYPANTSGWIGLGISRYFIGNINNAILAFDIAIKLGNNSITPFLWKIECFLKSGLRDKARALFSELELSKSYTTVSDSLHLKQMKHILELNAVAVGTA